MVESQKHAELEALRECEETIRALLNAPKDTAILVDSEGAILAINEIGALRFGKSADELIGMCGYDLLPPDLARERKARAEEVIRSGMPVRFEDERGDVVFDSHIYPVFDAQGEVTHLAVFGRDITEQKRKELALRRSEAKNRALVDAIPDMMFRVSKDGTLLEFEPANGIQPLLPPSEFLGKKVSEVLPDEIARQTMYHIGQVLETGLTQEFEYSLLEKGSTRHYEARLVVSGVRADEVLAIVRDITRRKVGQAMVEEERARLTRGLHDGLAQDLYFLGLKLDYIRKQVRRDPESVIGELRALKDTVQANIRDLRRTIFALRPVGLEELGFGPALRQYAQEFGEQMGLKVVLEVRGDDEILPEALELAFIRLVREGLNNIAKHAHANRAWIELIIQARGTARLTIRDDGLGFDPQALTSTDGSKLGLQQMRERVEGLGGRFSLESAPGQGTRLQAEIPL